MPAGKKFPLSIAIAAIDKVTKPMRKMRKGIDRVWAPTRRLRGALGSLSKAAGLPQVVKGFKGVGLAVGNVIKKVGSLVFKMALLGGAAVGFAVAMVRSTGQAGDNIAKTSAKLGIGVEKLQEYRFAAERAGVPTATFDMAMQRMGRRVGEAANGMGEARVALKVLGIEARDSEGKVRSIESLLPEVADKLSLVGTENERNALAMKLFDSEGVALVNMLSDGSKGLAEMTERARELGLVMSEEDVKAAEDFTDAQTDMFSALTGVKTAISAALMPQLTNLSKKLTDLVLKHRGAIQNWAANFAKSLPGRLQSIQEWLGKARSKLQELIEVVRPGIDRFGGLNIILGALAVLLFGPVIASLFAMIPAVYALGVALLATPIGWIILGLTAVVAAGVYMANRWEWVANLFSGIWKYIAGTFKFGWEMIKWFVSLILSPVDTVKAVWGGLTGFFSGMWSGIKGLFGSGVSWVTSKIKSLVGWLPDWVTGKLGFEVGGSIGSAQFGAPVPSGAVASASGTAAVRISFDDLPEGVQVIDEGNDGVPLDLDLGYSMGQV